MYNTIKNNKYMTTYIFLALVIMIYLLFVSNKKYESESTISIVYNQSSSSIGGGANNPLSLLSGFTQSNDLLRDIKTLELFLSSSNFFYKIDEKFNLRTIYNSSKHSNFYEKIINKNYIENYIERFNTDLSFYYEPDYNVIDLNFKFADKLKSQEILTFVIKELENKLNELNEKQLKQQSKFVKKEVLENKNKLDDVKNKLLTLQNKHHILDPNFNLEEKLKRLSILKSEWKKQDISYSHQKNILSQYNPDLMKIKNKTKTFKKYYLKQYNDIYYNGGNKLENKSNLNEILSTFRDLENQIAMRTEIYLISIKKYENLKLELLQKNKILEVIISPTLPERHAFPNMFSLFPTILFLLGMILFIFKNITSIIEEHNA